MQTRSCSPSSRPLSVRNGPRPASVRRAVLSMRRQMTGDTPGVAATLISLGPRTRTRQVVAWRVRVLWRLRALQPPPRVASPVDRPCDHRATHRPPSCTAACRPCAACVQGALAVVLLLQTPPTSPHTSPTASCCPPRQTCGVTQRALPSSACSRRCFVPSTATRARLLGWGSGAPSTSTSTAASTPRACWPMCVAHSGSST